jgi:RND family efflux transporter MFP subunit
VREAKIRVARDEFQRARILAQYAQIRAPFDGVISFRDVDVGDFIQNASTGQPHPLLTVIAIDKVRFVLQVPEKESTLVRPGTEVLIHVNALDMGEVKGKVARVSPSLDSQSRTLQVEVDLDNPDRKLKPGMYGEATLDLQRTDNAQAIPATAVYSRKGENFILLVHDGIVHRQKVRIRFDDGKELEVVKLIDGKDVPLDGTEELIVSNKGEIAEGQRVRSSKHAPR